MGVDKIKDHDVLLKKLFDAAIIAVGGRTATESALRDSDIDDVFLIAVGKAAPSMTHGALTALGTSIRQGLVISKYGHVDERLKQIERLECIESAHPVPDQNSLNAGQRLVKFVSEVPSTARLLFLTSGGASALIEALPDNLSLNDLQRVNEYLLSTGLDIVSMNRIRKSISTIKGGRLAGLLSDQQILHLLISDVPGDALSAIGSGMLAPPELDPTTADHPDLSPRLPDWLSAMQSGIAPPSDADPVWSRIDSRIIASNAIARAACAESAVALGLPLRLSDGSLDGPVEEIAERITAVLGDESSGDGVYIWGGETTVVLPDNPGRGGRNQHLALELANRLHHLTDWTALCCGTDGSDGPTGDAGGLVSPETVLKGLELGLDAEVSLATADAGHYLERTGGLMTTGPTGTNVMDLVIAIKGPVGVSR